MFLHHPSSLLHDTGPHPEQPARIPAILDAVEARGWLGWDRALSPPASREELTAVHPESHVDFVARVSASGGGQIDLDTVASSGSYEAALHAAGGAVRLAELLVSGEAPCGFSAHRPPGHHATRSRAMGFCLFNNIAVAARHAIDVLGLQRVMIVDWDVHHGNGTNDIFHSSPEVLFVSIHQSPLYPGSGRPSDLGSGEGLGFTVNLPVPPGSGDAVWCGLVDGVAVPLALAFSPQLILISAGFDAHVDDPLAGCAVTDAGFAAMASSIRRVADSLGVPVGGVLEGGYGLRALGRSVVATLEALASPGGGAPGGRAPASESELVRAAAARLAPWWPGLV